MQTKSSLSSIEYVGKGFFTRLSIFKVYKAAESGCLGVLIYVLNRNLKPSPGSTVQRIFIQIEKGQTRQQQRKKKHEKRQNPANRGHEISICKEIQEKSKTYHNTACAYHVISYSRLSCAVEFLFRFSTNYQSLFVQCIPVWRTNCPRYVHAFISPFIYEVKSVISSSV